MNTLKYIAIEKKQKILSEELDIAKFPSLVFIHAEKKKNYRNFSINYAIL